MIQYKFSENLSNIRMSPIVSISEEVRKRAPEFKAATGKDFVLFQRGEIDFQTPQYIVNAAKEALDAGYTKYPKSGGEDPFKEAVIKKLEYYNKATGFDKENIVCTYGGQESLELSFKLFEGKKGVGFAPCWSCVLENFVPYCGTDFHQVPLLSDFSIDFDRLDKALDGASFFYLNTPQNPTGKLFTKEEVTSIAELCLKHSAYLISDEAYEAVLFDNETHFSPTSLEYENIISTFTLSKTYAMTGWRLGYLVTRDKRIPKLLKLGNYTQTAGVTTFLQHAAAEALNNEEESRKSVGLMVTEFEKRRDFFFEGLKSIDGLKVTKPKGGFYFFPDFSAFIPKNIFGEERKLYVYNLLMNEGVATVYGSCFGNYFDDYIRFSFSTTPVPVIEEGLFRMKKVFSGA
ncbi:MAG TPA: aminotransferase class I/II-fold pyridoxal phosphate-dependent enzyme [Melioribacteraceae bacterium]|nr:aminotransferase class I/II-fold pyridoxal phosphate-dependent enzyme [Melioribacteraceae bacterium]